ncbi:hypothetical protein ZWY2020_035838 [Hordeum vulgare]|nr:hypothetical protein ZWY2020_035838 [Hordeum vulgare]
MLHLVEEEVGLPWITVQNVRGSRCEGVVQQQASAENIQVCDISSDGEGNDGVELIPGPNRGRFWDIHSATEEDDELSSLQDGVKTVHGCTSVIVERMSPAYPSPPSPSPSLAALHDGKIERDLILQRKKAQGASRKPWVGPIPKVNLPPLALSDFFKPDCWVTERQRSKKMLKTVRPATPALIVSSARVTRDRFLKSVIAAEGRVEQAQPATQPGYMAQAEVAVHCPVLSLTRAATASREELSGGPVSATQSPRLTRAGTPDQGVLIAEKTLGSIARARGRPGFPRLGLGRAAIVQSADRAASTMSGKGAPPAKVSSPKIHPAKPPQQATKQPAMTRLFSLGDREAEPAVLLPRAQGR